MGASESSEPVVQPPPITDPPLAPSQPPPSVQPPPAPTATQTTPLPPVPEIPPQPTIPPPPPPVTLPLPPKLQPLPIEQRCIACLNYHYHDHPSVKGESAGAITVKNYPDDSPRLKFEGIILKDQPEWFGRLTFRSGAVYEGGFRAGEFSGYGRYYEEGKYEYLGGYSNGKKEGYGREILHCSWGKEEYLGGWKDGVKHGEGLKNQREWVRYYMGTQVQLI